MADVVNDELSTGNTNTGQPGMLTPQQMEERERHLASMTEEERAAAEQRDAALAEAASIDEAALNAIQAKLDAGTALTPDEEAIVAKLGTSLTVLPKPEELRPPKTYQIGDKEYSEQEAVAKAMEENGLTELYQKGELSPAAVDKLTEQWAKAQNRSVAAVVVARGQRDNAAERQRLTAERLRLDDRRNAIKREEDRINAEKEKLKARAAVDVTEETATTPSAQVQFIRKTEAQERLQELDSRTQELAQEKTGLETEVTKMLAREFIVNHPQYNTTEDFFVVAAKVAKGETVDPEDRIKVLEVSELLDESVDKGQTLEDRYLLRSKSGALAVKPVAHATGPTNGALPPPTDIKQQIAEFRRRTRALAALGGGGIPRTSTVRSVRDLTARDIIGADQAILGDHRGEQTFREVLPGY